MVWPEQPRLRSQSPSTMHQVDTVKGNTVKPGDSKKQATEITNLNINYIIDSKQLAEVNIFLLLIKFTIARFECNSPSECFSFP